MHSIQKQGGKTVKQDKNLSQISKELKAQEANDNRLNEIMEKFSYSKPTNVDAQRIVTILDNLIAKTEIMQYLDSDFMIGLQDLKKKGEAEVYEVFLAMDNQIANMLLREGEIEQNLRPRLLDSTNQDNQGADFERTISEAKNHFRNLIRRLEQNPEDLSQLKSIRRTDPAKEYTFILTCFWALKRLMLKKLSTSAEEKKSHERQIEELSASIKDLERDKSMKQNEIDTLSQEKKRYNNDRTDEISKLTVKIQEIRNNGKSEDERLKKKSQEDKNRQEQKFNNEYKLKEEARNKIKTEFETKVKENGKAEDDLRTKKKNQEGSLQQTILDYDGMMDEKEKEIDQLESELEERNNRCRELTEELAALVAEEKKVAEIKAKIQAKQDQLDYEAKRQEEIIFAIQNAWTMYASKNKKKKKKKGKKK